MESQESVQHDLRRQNAFDEFLIEPEPSGHIGALHRAARRIFVIFAISSGALHFLKPFYDFAKP